jgi:hypothetical protein
MSDVVEAFGDEIASKVASVKANEAYHAALDAGQSEEAAHAVADELYAKLTAPAISDDAAASGAEAPVLTTQSSAAIAAAPVEQKKEYTIEERIAHLEGAIKFIATNLGHDIGALFDTLK